MPSLFLQGQLRESVSQPDSLSLSLSLWVGGWLSIPPAQVPSIAAPETQEAPKEATRRMWIDQASIPPRLQRVFLRMRVL